jgi:hypothetical protein
MNNDEILLNAMSKVAPDGSLSTRQMFEKLLENSAGLTEENKRQYEYDLGCMLRGFRSMGDFDNYKIGDWKTLIP